MITSTASNTETRNSRSLTIHTENHSFGTKTWTSPTSQEISNFGRTPLPFPQPLDREMFAASDFDSDTFLANRRHVTLDELKKELTAHLKSLKSELVEMINRDYASFIDLSTNLKGVDKVIEEVARPLGKMREEVQGVRTTLQGVIDSLENQLSHRASIREKKAALQLLINIHESVRKVENLLLISGDNASATTSGDKSGSNVKQIERVAIEYNQMQYLVNRGKDLPFVENIDWRITRIKDTLRINLSSALRLALLTIKDQSSTVSSKETLTQILRTYALIDQTKSAEEVIREDLVAPFIQETVSRPVLDNPSQQSTSHVYPARSTHPQSQISTKAYFTNAYSKEPLALMYNRILKFINAECYILLKITRNDLKGTSFEILVNSVWVEVVDSITKKLPVIFNPGNPNTFHKNYTISMNFLLSIESMCVSKKSLLYLRNHSSYMEFMKRWQLPVYFQLRFKGISSKIEEVLNVGSEIPVDGIIDSQDSRPLILPASRSIFLAIERCWADDVFIYGLSHRFWKLSLQLVQRYKNWLMSILTGLVTEKNDQGNDKPISNAKRSPNVPGGRVGSPAPSSTNGNISTEVQDDFLLKRLTIVSHDIENMEIKVKEFYREQVFSKLPDLVTDLPIIEESVNSLLASLRLDLPDFTQKISAILTSRCTETLRQHIRSIITQYRQPNTKPPTEASYFVPHIIKPLATFCDVNKLILSDNRRNEWCYSVGDAVSSRYYNIVYELLSTLKKTEESSKIMKRKKGKNVRSLASSLFSGNGSSDALSVDDPATLMSDEDKIRLQILLDVKQFGTELANIGLDINKIKGYAELYKVVEPYEEIQKT